MTDEFNELIMVKDFSPYSVTVSRGDHIQLAKQVV